MCQTTGQYVQADGTLGSNVIYQTKEQWGTITVNGLNAATDYCFYASAQNKHGDVKHRDPE